MSDLENRLERIESKLDSLAARVVTWPQLFGIGTAISSIITLLFEVGKQLWPTPGQH